MNKTRDFNSFGDMAVQTIKGAALGSLVGLGITTTTMTIMHFVAPDCRSYKDKFVGNLKANAVGFAIGAAAVLGVNSVYYAVMKK